MITLGKRAMMTTNKRPGRTVCQPTGLADKAACGLPRRPDKPTEAAVRRRVRCCAWQCRARTGSAGRGREDTGRKGNGVLQRVAMRMGRMATWSDESLLRRPPQEDR